MSVVYIHSYFSPQGTFCNFWRHFSYQNCGRGGGGRGLEGRGQGFCNTQDISLSKKRIIQSQTSIMLRLKSPALYRKGYGTLKANLSVTHLAPILPMPEGYFWVILISCNLGWCLGLVNQREQWWEEIRYEVGRWS